MQCSDVLIESHTHMFVTHTLIAANKCVFDSAIAVTLIYKW